MKAAFLIISLFLTVFLFGFSNLPSVAAQGLAVGDRGQEVTVLQMKLLEYGFYQGAVDGVYGLATQQAILDFQSASGLEVDGIVGSETLDKLRNYRAQTASRSGSNRRGRQIADYAIRYLGVPYVWAGNTPAGFDCSGFIAYVFRSQNIVLPRMADEQFEVGFTVPTALLQPGDLLFFSTYEPGASHVGIYIGDGKFIHASSVAGRVMITALASPYYSSHYLDAKRVF